jgi:hypothetical protein
MGVCRKRSALPTTLTDDSAIAAAGRLSPEIAPYGIFP